MCFREGGKFFLCIYKIWFFSPTKEIKNCQEKHPAPTHYVHHVYICPPRNYIQEFWDRFLPISALVWECEPPPPAAHPPKTALTWKESWANLQHVLPHGPRHKVPSVSGAGSSLEYEGTTTSRSLSRFNQRFINGLVFWACFKTSLSRKPFRYVWVMVILSCPNSLERE